MERGFSFSSALVLGILVALGLIGGGYFIGQGFARSKTGERYVTVRGLVERPVKADLAVWNINFAATSNDVSKANDEIQRDAKMVLEFAQSHGFAANEIQPTQTKVTDMLAQGYGREVKPETRYVVQGGIRIRSTTVDRIQQTSQMTGELVQKNIVLAEAEAGRANPAYFFTKLDSIRPPMLAEATRSARSVAQQFANDSGSQLGTIRRANQGVFEITSPDAPNSDELASIDKKVRLVTTVDYLLVN
jgi:uncharacterized protein